MGDLRTRYCQRCFSKQVLVEIDNPRPCARCGGVNFDAQPPRHHKLHMELTTADKNFLRANRIDPEEDLDWWNI